MVKPGEKMAEQCGTPAYIAPEILRNKGYEGYAVDVWSAGIVLYAMVYGTVPFKASSMKELHALIMRGKFSMKEDASENVRDLIEKMLESNPRKRWTIPQILCHTWFSGEVEEVQLFTEEEKEGIRKEFKHAGRKEEELESDWFTEHDLEASQNELTRNISSKSNLLAPFNTSLSHLSDEGEPIDDLILPRRVFKLAAKVRDIDRQYEKNNNCELDNGVYNKLVNGSSKGNDNEELNPFGSNDEPGAEEAKQSKKSENTEDATIDGLDGMTKEPTCFSLEKVAAQIKILDSLVQHPFVIGRTMG